MEIIPAIDLRAGAVVRLLQGDYAQQSTFADNPVPIALGFEAAGARRIHVVDTIPRSSAGKILRHELRTTLAERPYTTS